MSVNHQLGAPAGYWKEEFSKIAALEKGEDFYRNLVEESPIALFIADTRFQIGYLNPEALALLDIPKGTDSAIDLLRFFQPEEKTVIQQICQEVIAKNRPFLNYRGRIVNASGKLLEVLIDFRLWVSAEYNFQAIQGTIRDISPLTEVERELIVEKDRLETILGSVGVGLVIVDRNRNVFYTNEVMQSRFGRPGDRRCYSYYGRNTPCDDCVLEQVLAGSELGSLLVKGTNAESKECWAELLSSPVRDKQGEIIGALEVVLDITEKKRLAERLGILAEVVENMHEGVAITDLKGRIIYANKSLCQQTQKSDEQLYRTSLGEVFSPGSEDQVSFEEWLKVPQKSMSGEYGCRQNSGESLPILLSTFRIEDQQGAAYALVAVSLNLTDRKRLEADLLQSSKLAALGELISGITHELNNPLASIMGYSQLLLRRIEGSLDSTSLDKLRKSAQSILNESERASKIIRNLLTFARRYRPEKTPVIINEVLEKTLDLRLYELKVNNVIVETEYGQGLPLILADFNQLQQVILNLINNAVQAMTEQATPRIIRIRTRLTGKSIRIEIADSGPGIPPEIVRKIFDPFFTTKEVGKGTGLGLSICFGIIQEHGGSIHVEKSPEGGASFIIDLPTVICGEIKKEQETPPIDETSRPSMRILVVDDEMHIRTILQEYLEEQNFEVIVEPDGLAALEQLANTSFDLVITDLKMPKIDGRLLYEAICRQYPDLSQKVIFSTGDTLNEETNKFIRSTGNPILRKPIKLEKVLQAIDTVLEKESR